MSNLTGPVRTQATEACEGSLKKSLVRRSVKGRWKSLTYSVTPCTCRGAKERGGGGFSAGLGGWGRSAWECEASMERGPSPGVGWVGNRWCGHSQDEGEMAPR